VDGYSRLIALLKVLLPLMALALLSTLFLLSRNQTITTEIPYADPSIQNRQSGQQITEPFFSGSTDTNDRIFVSATRLVTTGSNTGQNEIEEVFAQIDTPGGTRIQLEAKKGTVNLNTRLLQLQGDVVFTTSTGYELRSDLFNARTATLHVHAPGPVTGLGLFGTLDAGAMTLHQTKGQESPHLSFNNGVRLLYKPKGQGK
jgi:lipopolysaccharide export system protein LptC